VEKPCQEPWLQARLEPRGRKGDKGVFELSISFRYHHFPLNVFTLLHGAAFVAENLGVRAYEMSGGSEISADNVEEVAGEDSPLLRELIEFWKKGQREVDPGKMLFELPSGGADRGNTAAGFRLRFSKPVPITEVLAPPSEAMRVESGEARAALVDRASNEPLVYASLIQGTDLEVFIWPGWRMDAPFTEIFGQTLAAAQRAQARLGGELRWMGEPWSPKEQAWLDRHPKLLSVELFEYVFENREPRPRERWVRKG
jgi:hypothetical protein